MENLAFVDQIRLRRVSELLAAQPEVFCHQGCVVGTWRLEGGRRWGPFYSLRFREGRKQRSVYLGVSAALAAAVRDLLAKRQRPRREHLALARLRAATKAALRRHLPIWRRHLREAGLSFKGFEIRSWKSLRPWWSLTAPPPSKGDYDD